METYKYYIETSDGSFSREIFPHDILDFGKTTKRNPGKKYYRWSPTKELTLINDDAIWASNFCKGNDISRDDKLIFKIIRQSDKYEWLKASFRFYDVEVETDDVHYAKAIFKPVTEDDYTEFELNKDKDYNIITKELKKVTISYKSSGLEFVQSYQLSEIPENYYYLLQVATHDSSNTISTLYCREYAIVPESVSFYSTGWIKIETDKNNLSKWVRNWNVAYPDLNEYVIIRKQTNNTEYISGDTGQWYYFSELPAYSITTNNVDTTIEDREFTVIADYSANAASLPDGHGGSISLRGQTVILYNDYAFAHTETNQIIGIVTARVAHNLKNCIQQLLDNFTTRKVKSSFFWNDPYPDGTTPIGNYVTQLQGSNILNNLYIIDKLDFKRPTASQLTTVANITLSDLNSDLYSLFQVYPFIDKNGDYRYEHINFWKGEPGIDLTNLYPEFISDRSFKFDKIGVGREKFSLPESKNTDFRDNNIEYDNIAPKEDGENADDYPVKKLYTDCDYILNNIESSSNDGFVFVILDMGTLTISSASIEINTIRVSYGRLSVKNIQNAELSWANLLFNYWKYDRPYSKGYINGVLINFTMKKIKRGAEIKLTAKEDIDPEKHVKTYIGEGTVDKLTEYLTGDKEIELVYDI
jgi:hypothetical protein